MFEFSTNYAILIASLFILISVLISYLFYRNTVIPSWKKYALISIKSLAFFFILMLFIQPVLLSLLGRNKSAQNVVLIDNSRSIKLNGKNITGEFVSSVKNRGENVILFTFSKDIHELNNTDSLINEGSYTDLADAFEKLKFAEEDNFINSVTILSDGNFNSGGNPLYNAKTLNCPVLTVPAGDSVQPPDIIIYNTSHNKTAYINTKTAVTVYMKAYKTEAAGIKLALEKEGNIISEKQVPLSKSENFYTAVFDITESVPGKYKYRIQAGNIPGEVTYSNNYIDFYIEFLDNKVKLLYVSGGPSYDNAVISSILKRINNFEASVKTLKSGSEFYEGKIDPQIYNELSAIMLFNFPSTKFTGKELDEIYTSSKKFNIPIVFFAGKNSDYKKLEMVSDLTPFTVTQTSTAESQVKIQPVNLPMDITFSGGNFPDLNRNFKGVLPKAGAVTLITDKYSGEPVLITRNNGNFSTTAFLAYGFWQWNLKSGNEKEIGEIIEKSIKLSLNKNKNKKLIITPVNEFFDYSEDVLIKGEVFDENNNPLINAGIKGVIKGNNEVKIKDIEFKYDKGAYFSNCGKMPIGDYMIEGEAVLNNAFYAKDNNRFSVDSLNTEYLQSANDYQSLRELANNTGGVFASPSNIIEIISGTKNQNIAEKSSITGRINLRENAHYLALIILLFSIEWVVRKRNNIP